jgi:small GTP-binding protein
MGTSHIRNFSIIAHIDHGKSTLADRILEITGAVAMRDMSAQLLDSMDLERERGITIKASAVRFDYKAKSGETYLMNLIDTPGHVDFTYEVSRALAACEGALLVVDATQGVEAQTVANMYLALENNLEIIPVINKIDLPSAIPDHVEEEIVKVLGIDHIKPPRISAKEGTNIDQVLESIVANVPPPKDNAHLPLRALIFDSFYDSYKGVIAYIRVFDGEIKKGQKIRFMANNKEYEVMETGMLMPKMTEVGSLSSGHVGYIAANVKTVSDLRIGDTVTSFENPAKEALPGYKDIKPMVFCGVYPVDNTKYEVLREALTKYKLNDCSVNFEPENSVALGFGFRCGFLGLLHMDVFQERIEREYGIVEAGFRLQKKECEIFRQYFGDDIFVCEGYNLKKNYEQFYKKAYPAIKEMRLLLKQSPGAPAAAEEDGDIEVPHGFDEIFKKYRDFETVAMIYDDVEGINFYPDFEKFQKLFSGDYTEDVDFMPSENGAPESVAELKNKIFFDYLNDESISPLVFKKMYERYPGNTLLILSAALNFSPKDFVYDRDIEKYLYNFKSYYYRTKPIPSILPVDIQDFVKEIIAD